MQREQDDITSEEVRETIASVASFLGDEDMATRRKALEFLAEVGDFISPHADILADRLREETSPDLICQVAELLGRCGSSAAGYEPLLIALLSHEDVRQRRAAARGLEGLPRDLLLPHIKKLSDLLVHEDEKYQVYGMRVLAQLGGEVARPYLHQICAHLFNGENWEMRRAAIWFLHSIGTWAEPHCHMVAELLHDPDWEIQRAAIEFLGDLAISEESTYENGCTERADGNHSYAPSVAHTHAEDVLSKINHPFWKVRREVCLSLGKMSVHLKENKYIGEVVCRLKDSDHGVREAATEAIQAWRSDAALAHMDQVAAGLDHEDVGSRLSSVFVLNMWTRQGHDTAHLTDVVARQLGLDVDVGLLSASLECLESMGSEACAPHVGMVVNFLEHRVPQIIFLALRVLSCAGAAAAPYCDRILPFIESDGSGIRMYAITALGCFGHSAAKHVERIKAIMANDYSELVREAASEALDKLRDATMSGHGGRVKGNGME